jgi:integrase/recombinase XerD
MAICSLSKDELRRLLAAAKMKRERDWLLFLVAFSHGLRAREVVSLTRDNFADGYITVQRLKGSLRTTQPLVKDEEPLFSEVPALFDWLRNTKPGCRVFPITKERFWQLMQEHGRAADIPAHKRHPHVLKHTIATLSIRGSAKIDEVRQYLGHKSLSSTGEYLKITDEDAANGVRAALRG